MKNESRCLTHFLREVNILKEENTSNEPLIIDGYIEVFEKIVEIFSSQGHSGFSASCYSSYLSHALKQTLNLQPLSPLTGKDHEWINVSEYDEGSMLYQNNRDSAVFKDGYGCKYNDAIVFQGEDDFDSFTGSVGSLRSSQYIKSFPFTPKRFTVHVYRELYDENNPKHQTCKDIVECGPGTFAYFLKDENELKEVSEYYDLEKTKFVVEERKRLHEESKKSDKD